MTWLAFDTLEPLRDRVKELLAEVSLTQLQSLTGYGYILQALQGLNGSFL